MQIHNGEGWDRGTHIARTLQGPFALMLPGLRAPGRADSAAPWVAGAGALVAVAATPLARHSLLVTGKSGLRARV